jgi:beta-glucosidase
MVDGKPVSMQYLSSDQTQAKTGHVQLEKGERTAISVSYSLNEPGPVEAQLIWSKYDPKPSPEAVSAAKNADVVIAVLGITSDLEGEEMPVNEEGFKGGDRTSIDLPKPEEDLLKAVTATGRPVILVLANGSALAVNWANEHVNAILESWYAGEEGGSAIAETLSGKNNPAGRLPVTFYTGVEQLPLFEDYSMQNRTYRYFKGKPLYPFGYGLSYTTFSYSDLTLRGFKRVHLSPGETQKVRFELKNRDLSMVSEAGVPMIAEGSYSISIGGGQPNTGAPTVSGMFQVTGTKTLSE